MIFLSILITISNTVFWGAIIPAEGHYYFRKKQLLWEETYIGAGVGIAAALLIKWWLMFILAPVCGLLWAYGGAKGTSKDWRRVGVGVVIALAGLLNSFWALLVIITMNVATRPGYGILCIEDKGSLIGKFWLDIVKDKKLTDKLTRVTVGLLYGLALIPLMWKR